MYDCMFPVIPGNGQSLYNVCSYTSLEFTNVYSISNVINILFITTLNDSIHMTVWAGKSQYHKMLLYIDALKLKHL